MLTPGHVKFLKKAAALGDFLIVGLFSDINIQRTNGPNYPVLDINERALNLLGIKYVDDVVLDAPLILTPKFLRDNRIDFIAEGDP